MEVNTTYCCFHSVVEGQSLIRKVEHPEKVAGLENPEPESQTPAEVLFISKSTEFAYSGSKLIFNPKFSRKIVLCYSLDCLGIKLEIYRLKINIPSVQGLSLSQIVS